MKPGVVVGLVAEARVAAGLGWMVEVGGGTARGARLAAERLVAGGADALVSFGLAGGLDPAARPGDLVVPELVVTGDEEFYVDGALVERLGGVTGGRLLAHDAVLATAEAKLTAFEETGAMAVDLESGSVAQAAGAHGLPFAVLRAICDPADRSLPPAALIALDRAGGIGVRRLAGSLARRPGQIRALLRLACDAAAARTALRDRVRLIGARV